MESNITPYEKKHLKMQKRLNARSVQYGETL